MSDRRSGAGWLIGGVAALGLLAVALGGGDNPSTPEDESRSCAEARVNEDCVNGHPMCPAPKVCPTVDTTPQTVPSIVEQASSTTLVPELATVAPTTTVVPMQQRPSSEQAPQTAPPETAPPETPPPATEPQPARPDPNTCDRPFTIQSGDNSWAIVADRLDVWTRDLLTMNGINEQEPRLVGAKWCAPPSVYGNGPATTQAPPQVSVDPSTSAAPVTQAPQAPPTQAPTTQAPTTTEQRRSPGGERTTTTIKPVWVQATQPTAPPTTKAPQAPPKQPQAPATTAPATQTTRVGPGTIRTTVPPV